MKQVDTQAQKQYDAVLDKSKEIRVQMCEGYQHQQSVTVAAMLKKLSNEVQDQTRLQSVAVLEQSREMMKRMYEDIQLQKEAMLDVPTRMMREISSEMTEMSRKLSKQVYEQTQQQCLRTLEDSKEMMMQMSAESQQQKKLLLEEISEMRRPRELNWPTGASTLSSMSSSAEGKAKALSPRTDLRVRPGISPDRLLKGDYIKPTTPKRPEVGSVITESFAEDKTLLVCPTSQSKTEQSPDSVGFLSAACGYDGKSEPRTLEMSDVRTSVGLQASREPAECAAQAPLMTTLHQSSGYPIAREGYQHLNNHNPAVIPVVKNGVDIGVRDKLIASSETPYAALIECVKLLCEQTRQPNAAALPAAVNVREAGDQAHTTVKNERSLARFITTECP